MFTIQLQARRILSARTVALQNETGANFLLHSARTCGRSFSISLNYRTRTPRIGGMLRAEG